MLPMDKMECVEMSKYKRSYTESEYIHEIEKTIISKLPFYSQPYVNYRGKTSDSKVKYTEVMARKLLLNKDAINSGLNEITRMCSYRTDSHNGSTAQNADKRRKEERIAMAMFRLQRTYQEFGKILDYQIPLKNDSSNKGIGKIDLVSYDEGSDTLYLLELKIRESRETLLRCVLEVYSYSKIINEQKLKSDFDRSSAKVVPAALVFENSLIHKEYLHDAASVKELMHELGVQIKVIPDEYAEELIVAATEAKNV